MAQIGTVRLETQNSGVVDVPVFEPGDSASGIYEFVRVETASGPGFIPVTDPVDATYPYLRVQSQNNGIVAVTDTPGSDIPDSDLYYPVDEGSGTTLNDAVGTNDASITGSPSWVSDSDYWGDYYLDFTDGDYAEISDNSILGMGFDWSVAVTIIAAGSLSNRGVVWNWSDGTNEIGLTIENGSDIAAGWFDGSTFQIEIGESLPSTPFTIRATVRWDSSDNSMGLFIDASEVTGSVKPSAIQAGDIFVLNDTASFGGRHANEGLDAFRVKQDHIDPQTDYDDQPWS